MSSRDSRETDQTSKSFNRTSRRRNCIELHDKSRLCKRAFTNQSLTILDITNNFVVSPQVRDIEVSDQTNLRFKEPIHSVLSDYLKSRLHYTQVIKMSDMPMSTSPRKSGMILVDVCIFLVKCVHITINYSTE